MKRRNPSDLYRRMGFPCVLCNRADSIIFAWRIFQLRLTVPICFRCEKKHGTPGQDTITPVLEAKLMKIFASEKAFWHPGEPINTEPKKDTSDE